MEKIMNRTKTQYESEKKIVEEVKKFDLKIKKLEKEEKSIYRILNSKDLLEDDKDDEDKKEKRKAGAQLRSNKMFAPLPSTLSPTLLKKLEIVMEELGINDDYLTCTESVGKKYERLQLLIIRMLCIEKHIKTQEEERERIANQPKHWVRLVTACNNKCLFCLDMDTPRNVYLGEEEVKAESAEAANAPTWIRSSSLARKPLALTPPRVERMRRPSLVRPMPSRRSPLADRPTSEPSK